MKEEKRRIPKRRFKEFQGAGEWEVGKLDKLANFSKGSGYSKADLTTSGFPIIMYGRLYTKYETVISKVDTFISDNSKAFLSKGNEVIVPASGETAEDISRASVVESENIALGGDLNIIYPNEKIDSIFLALNISNGSQQKEMIKRAQGKSVVHLHNSDLKRVLLTYPKIKEQQKIGDFFKKLDELITIQQKKLDKTKALKSAYLTEMFPAIDETKPKRRFAGFADDWVEKKLSEMTEYKNGKGYEDKVTEQGFYELINLNSISIDGGLKSSGKYIDNAELTLLENDLVMILSDVGHGDLLGRVAIIPKSNKYVLNQRVALLRPNDTINAHFLFVNINAHQNYFKMQGAGMSQLNISKKSVEDFSSLIPKIQEQEKIGNFFKQLDDNITKQQEKLEKLQNLKKAYLNEMFV